MLRMYRRTRIQLLLLTVVVMCGCRQTLFPMSKQRNQFEAYNTMRYGPPILKQPDPFGLPEPALRARLERNHE